MTPSDVVVYDIGALGVVRAAVHAPTMDQAQAFEAVLQCCAPALLAAHILLGRYGTVTVLTVSMFEGVVLPPPPSPHPPSDTPFAETTRFGAALAGGAIVLLVAGVYLVQEVIEARARAAHARRAEGAEGGEYVPYGVRPKTGAVHPLVASPTHVFNISQKSSVLHLHSSTSMSSSSIRYKHMEAPPDDFFALVIASHTIHFLLSAHRFSVSSVLLSVPPVLYLLPSYDCPESGCWYSSTRSPHLCPVALRTLYLSALVF